MFAVKVDVCLGYSGCRRPEMIAWQRRSLLLWMVLWIVSTGIVTVSGDDLMLHVCMGA